MSDTEPARAHLVTGGFPPGMMSGHDHDYARLKLLGLLAERDIPASVANDFADVERWLPLSRLLITYVAGPYPSAAQCAVLRAWLEAGGRWLGLHGTSGGRAARPRGGPRGAGRGPPPAPRGKPRPPGPAGQFFPPPPADPRVSRRNRRRFAADTRSRHIVCRRGRALFYRAAGSRRDPDPAH